MFDKLIKKVSKFISGFLKELSEPIFSKEEEQGKQILQKEIKEQQLLEKGVTATQLKNLYVCLGEGLISMEIVREFLQEEREWRGNQFMAMISNQGFFYLGLNELTWKDFCNKYISNELATEQILDEIIQLKKLEMDFFTQASEDLNRRLCSVIKTPLLPIPILF